MSDKKKKAEPGYAEASGELEQILQDIESGDIDLDLLSDKVARAAALLTFCRQKLAATEVQVKKITSELAAAMDHDPAGDGGTSGDDDDGGDR